METKPEFKVVAWKDLHGVETFFAVVSPDGYRCGVYASEPEAIAAAAKAAAGENIEAARPSFALGVR
jgi:hypothetical protein